LSDLEAIGSAALLLMLGAMSPGPSLMVVVRNTVSAGRLQGVSCGIGHGLGFGVYALVAMFGLSTLLRDAPAVFSVAQMLGALLLLYLAYKTWGSTHVTSDVGVAAARRNAFIEGFLVAILNPKIALFFLAVFSAVLSSDLQPRTQYLIALIGWLIDTSWYVLVAVLLSTAPALRLLTDKQHILNPLMAILLAGLGALTLYRLFA
jgi:threonine/homoserine/homoserine lactone efflux protein